MWPQMTNLLAPWQWAVLAVVPPAIVALYFLKLKRAPLEVPSTYLWRKSIEDLHVNSLWQRLRRSILLLLQLLLLLIILLALLNFSWRGESRGEQRTIYLIDNSASMQTRDVDGGQRTRLEEAKRRVADAIDTMQSGDAAMIISFSDTAQVVQQYTGNRPELRRQLKSIQPTNHSTSIIDALRLAAGLANPGRTSDDPNDLAAADAVPAELRVFSDFRFSTVSDFALGNLEPKLDLIGQEDTGNVAIVNFSTRRHEDRPDMIHTFARIQRYAQEDSEEESADDETTVRVELLLDGSLIDAAELSIKKNEFGQVEFTREDIEVGVLELRVDSKDTLALDDRAWAVINRPERRRVLFVSKGNEPIERAFSSESADKLARIELAQPEHLESEDYKKDSESGLYDLIIFDECAPQKMPPSNTLFINALPPDGRWKRGDDIADGEVQVIDTEKTHPLMKLPDLGDVDIYRAFNVERPSGGVDLIDSAAGSIFSIAPRDGYEDAVLGFSLGLFREDGELYPNTNWRNSRSFPVFWRDVLAYLGGTEARGSSSNVSPGDTYQLRGELQSGEVKIIDPAEKSSTVSRNRQNLYEFTDTQQLGVYQVWSDDQLIQLFAVNLFDRDESDNRTRPEEKVRLGLTELAVGTSWQPARRELWKWLALLGLVVLLVEWYIYNRRVYL